ncbi:MAG: hypothetical protein HQ573_03615 [Desulfobacteraceae bacterium]|nr:hypothetical protein [Desulfobacteraceae bacterium]
MSLINKFQRIFSKSSKKHKSNIGLTVGAPKMRTREEEMLEEFLQEFPPEKRELLTRKIRGESRKLMKEAAKYFPTRTIDGGLESERYPADYKRKTAKDWMAESPKKRYSNELEEFLQEFPPEKRELIRKAVQKHFIETVMPRKI